MACIKNPVALMNKRVTVQDARQLRDGQGGVTEVWEDVATVWASIEPVKDYQRMQAMQLQNPITHKVMMRYRSDFTPQMRLVFDTRVFSIVGMINLNENNSFFQLYCEEVPNLHVPDTTFAIMQDDSGWLNQDGSTLVFNHAPIPVPADAFLFQDGSRFILQDASYLTA
jgi:SPP1 family predicted phage head-tail adaptor